MKKIMIFNTLLVCLISLTACGGDDDSTTQINDTVTCGVNELQFTADKGDQTVQVTATREWKAYSESAWITISPNYSTNKEATITVSAAENNTYEQRTGKVTVLAGAARTNIQVTQAAKEKPAIDPSITVPEGYELVWNDEFTGSSLSTDWTHEIQSAGWVNNELQNYINGDGVTAVSDGALKITCKQKDDKVYSGRIYAMRKTGWKYGYFEAKIKLPSGKGTWPAFWMMPVNYTSWPGDGEIDIMEEVGCVPNEVSSSIHCNAYNHMINTQKTHAMTITKAEGEYHVYALEWTENAIKTYVDGKEQLSFANDGKNNKDTWPFNANFYVILNLAWGGSWGGMNGVDASALPVTMDVDYVRVFQKKK